MSLPKCFSPYWPCFSRGFWIETSSLVSTVPSCDVWCVLDADTHHPPTFQRPKTRDVAQNKLNHPRSRIHDRRSMLCDEFARERRKRRRILRCGTVPADPNGSFFSRFETVAIQTNDGDHHGRRRRVASNERRTCVEQNARRASLRWCCSGERGMETTR